MSSILSLVFGSLWLFFHYHLFYPFPPTGLSEWRVKGPEQGGEAARALPSHCETKPNMLIKRGTQYKAAGINSNVPHCHRLQTPTDEVERKRGCGPKRSRSCQSRLLIGDPTNNFARCCPELMRDAACTALEDSINSSLLCCMSENKEGGRETSCCCFFVCKNVNYLSVCLNQKQI